MTDEVDLVRQEFATEIAAASAAVAAASAALDRLRALSTGTVAISVLDQLREPPNDLIFPGDAVHLSGLSRAHVHRLCALTRYRIDEPGGFAIWMKDQNCWMVSRSRFERFLKQRPRRKRDTKRRNIVPGETS
jgi:hypothetical protein